jgi:cytochrome c-type biogenesis protein CcmH/NrfG
MFTKESAILFPLLALFYAFGFRKGKVFSLYILLLVEGWAIILVNWNILRAASMVVPVGDKLIAATTVLSNLGLAVYYFGKIFWPFSLAFAPVFPDAHLAAGIISAVLLSIALLLSERRDWKLIIFGVLWFLVFLIPTFYYNTAVHTPPKFYEHRVYVPFMGILFILLSLSFTGIGQTFKRIIPTLTILLTGAFALLSYYHTADFKNSITLSEYDAATSPNDPRQYRNITRMKIPDTLTSEIQAVQGRSQIQASKDTLVTKEELWRIIDNLKKGLQSDRHNPEIFHALAVAYFARGLFLSSEKSFFAALQQTPHNAVLPYNLGILYYSAHAVTKAEHAWLEALRLDPSLGDAHLNLSFLYYESGQYRSAWDHCQKALQLGKEVPLRLIQDIRIKIS